MLKLIERVYDKIRDVYGPRHFPALLALLLVISAAGLLVGLKYTRYIRSAPEYCNSCHLMHDTYTQWRESYHKTVTCQECHRLGLIEQNMLQVKYILYGTRKTAQKHGKTIPWQACAQCHWEQSKQGSDKPEESYGHYKHHFVECFNCHPFSRHDFPPDTDACLRCHKSKEVHGVGMEGLSCIDCHIFSQREGTEKNRVIPTKERCMRCHVADKGLVFPENAPMARLECFECHNPHGAITPSDKLCRSCHEKDVADRGHALHKNACKDCHKAHVWTSPDPAILCGRCHPARPASLFNKNK